MGGASDAFVHLEGDVASETSFVVDSLGKLAARYGPAALFALGALYALVISGAMLCEACACILGAPALGAPALGTPSEEDGDQASGTLPDDKQALLQKAKRPSEVGSVVSAML